MTRVSPYLSTVTLTVNGLNSSIKRHGVAEKAKKEKTKNRKQELNDLWPSKKHTSPVKTQIN